MTCDIDQPLAGWRFSSRVQLSPDVEGFWQWFADHEAEILEIMEGRKKGKVTELIDAALSRSGLGLTYEVTGSSLGGELTFTPSGDPVTARFIDEVVARAPNFQRWTVFGRCQRKSLEAALSFVRAMHDIDISDARFLVRYVDGRFNLAFIHPRLARMDEQARYDVAATFLDHALGEALTMELVGGIEFGAAGDGISMSLMVNQIVLEAEGLRD